MVVHLQSSFEDCAQHRDYGSKSLENLKFLQFKEHSLWNFEVDSNPSKDPLLSWLPYGPAPENATRDLQGKDRDYQS